MGAEAEKTVALRYCGGCNPRYDRVALVKRLEGMLPERRFVPAETGGVYDAALVVCGCKTKCARTDDLSVPTARTVWVSGFEELLAARDALNNLPEAERARELTREEVQKLLPHRPPVLFLDRVTRLIPGQEAVAVFFAAPELALFKGHFPGKPVFPGTALVEAMAQAADVMLLSREQHRGKTPWLMGLGRANFRRPVLPGETLEIRASLVADKPEMGASVCRGQVLVNGKLTADAEIILALR